MAKGKLYLHQSRETPPYLVLRRFDPRDKVPTPWHNVPLHSIPRSNVISLPRQSASWYLALLSAMRNEPRRCRRSGEAHDTDAMWTSFCPGPDEITLLRFFERQDTGEGSFNLFVPRLWGSQSLGKAPI